MKCKEHTYSRSAHTAGPWRIELLRHKLGPNTGMVSETLIRPVAEGTNAIARVLNWIGTEKQDVANARLIAAAPELLEALKKAVAVLDEDDSGPADEFVSELRAAIAKAERSK